MEYAKVENNQVIQIGLQSTGVLKDGSTVSGYNLLDEATLKAEGWLPLIDNPPGCSEYEYIEHEGYTITENTVIVNYVIKAKENNIVDESIDDEKVAMAEAIVDLETRLSALEGRV